MAEGKCLMTSLKNLKPGKLVNCRINFDGKSCPAVIRKLNNRVDRLVDFEVVIPKRYRGRGYLLDENLKVELDDVIIKHKGYTLND